MEWLDQLINLAIVVLPHLGEPVLSIVGGASIIASVLAPKENKIYSIARKLLNGVAFNFNHAKNEK